jgi:hypothetical protein
VWCSIAAAHVVSGFLKLGKTLTILFRPMGGLLSVHLFPQMRNAVNIKTIVSPTIDAVKSQLHTTEVFRFIT